MRRMFPTENGPLSKIPGTGPAPALLRTSEWIKVTPTWEALTRKNEADEEAKKKLEWVREMYAFSVALALERVELDLPLPPHNTLVIQPPADSSMGQASQMHYTWGSIFKNSSGAEVWQFDKRKYTEEKYELNPPLMTLPPPFQEGLKLQDGKPITRDLYDTLYKMIELMNAGIATLKPLA